MLLGSGEQRHAVFLLKNLKRMEGRNEVREMYDRTIVEIP